MEFPFSSIRPQQEKMINDVSIAVHNNRHIIADAPTGLGKTVAALYPSVRYATEEGKTVLFLTSRLSQHKMAVETLQQMGIMNAVDIIGKKWLCSHDVGDMDNSSFSNFCYFSVKENGCDYYRNFKKKGDITQDAQNMLSTLKHKGPLHSEDAKLITGKKFCTYEMLMEMAKGSCAVVCDYFHAFSADTKFFRRAGKDLKDCIIIADEAHNLPDRIRRNQSSKLSTRLLGLAEKENREFDQNTGGRLECIEEALRILASRHLLDSEESFVKKEELIDVLRKFYDYNETVDSLIAAGINVMRKRKRSFIEKIGLFLERWTGEDYGYARLLSREMRGGKDYITLSYSCMDPSLITKSIISGSHSVILMSGTLSPMEMYRDLLGMEATRTDLHSYSSPFPKSNRLNIIATGITTKYSKRTTENYAKIATVVSLCAASIRGNAAVFFPSYEIMKTIHSIAKDHIKKPVFMEMQDMRKEERRNLIEEFASNSEKGALLFGVLAGSFSEGIDLPGDKLNGVIVIGLPLERPSLATKALTDYYQQRFNRGIEYGYIYPAMIKVMQAAGRCIRSETDLGVCVFGDERFTWKNYRNIFPSDMEFVATDRPETEIRKFFDGKI